MPPRPNPFGRPPIRGRGAGGAPRGRPAMPRFVPPNPDQMRQEKEEKEQARELKPLKDQTEKPVKQAPQLKHSPFGGPPPEESITAPTETSEQQPVVSEQTKQPVEAPQVEATLVAPAQEMPKEPVEEKKQELQEELRQSPQ
mmetsp:Transcript_14725/g.22816  ORF Transcript_14725/g.22816 Transcript_14725/m.22816 type:complete len:142 (+) Transcript_14725:1-426(+)